MTNIENIKYLMIDTFVSSRTIHFLENLNKMDKKPK